MIRLRDMNGATRDLDEGTRFIELCSEDGMLAAVFYLDDSGTVHFTRSGEPDFLRYCRLYGLRETAPLRHVPNSAIIKA